MWGFFNQPFTAWSLNQNPVASVVDESNEEILHGLHALYVTCKDLYCFFTLRVNATDNRLTDSPQSEREALFFLFLFFVK